MIPLDAAAPDLRPLLAAFREGGGQPFGQLPVAEARRNYLASCRLNGLPGEAVASVETLVCPVDGGAIDLRLYRGVGTPVVSATPVILFLHGGGWVVGNLDSHDAICRFLANHTGATVVAVDYRLAPEYKYPVPLQDCSAALSYLVAHSALLRLDLGKLVIAGDSAGGNMATVLATRSDLRPAGLAVAAQVLLYPVTDLRAGSASYQRVSTGFPLTAGAMHWFRAMYTEPGTDFGDPMLSPLCALPEAAPPMFIVTVGLDPLADEGIAYATQAALTETQVVHHHLPQHMHGIFTAAGKVETGRRLLGEAAAFIRTLLASGA